jgi:oligopeptide/dipeptide ABC transporter ATP-binding protein
MPSLLSVDRLTVHFPAPRSAGGRQRHLVAVDDVTFAIGRGTTLALVGESGSGKTTTARAIMQVQPTVSGSVVLDGRDLGALRGRELRSARRSLQMIFQDPQLSLDPRQTVAHTLEEALAVVPRLDRAAREPRINELLTLVGLPIQFAGRYPHELSGGQRQRVGIARAIAVEPELLVCDEPVSALDVSVQAQIMNLLKDLQTRLGLTMLFIAHDLAVVRHIADEVAVMYFGGIVEIGPADEVYGQPSHPYTAALLSAAPIPDAVAERARQRVVLTGEIPRPDAPPSGCAFHPRCPRRAALGKPEICETHKPVLSGSPGVACHFPLPRA